MDATNSNAPQGQRQTRKSWLVTWTLGLFFGWFGADRFYVGDTARAMLKALTCGACGIWWFVDLVEIYYGRFRLADVRLSNTDQQLCGAPHSC